MGVGPLEFLVIIIVALIFVGPERLPRLAADMARTIRELRKYTTAIADEFGDVIKDFEKQTEGERGELSKLSETLTGATKSVTETIRGARADAEGLPSPAANGGQAPAAAPQWRDIPEPDAPPANGVSAPASENGHRPEAASAPSGGADEAP